MVGALGMFVGVGRGGGFESISGVGEAMANVTPGLGTSTRAMLGIVGTAGPALADAQLESSSEQSSKLRERWIRDITGVSKSERRLARGNSYRQLLRYKVPGKEDHSH